MLDMEIIEKKIKKKKIEKKEHYKKCFWNTPDKLFSFDECPYCQTYTEIIF